jgi:phosphoribosylformylglycinamidine (FGAM) synthase-like enzyme
VRHIERIAQIERQLAGVDKIMKCGDLIAAGLSVSLTIGPTAEDRAPDVDLEITTEMLPILELMKKALNESRRVTVMFAREDMKKLQEFFAREDAAVKPRTKE